MLRHDRSSGFLHRSGASLPMSKPLVLSALAQFAATDGRPQHDQGGLCRGGGRRRHDDPADGRARLSRPRTSGSMRCCGLCLVYFVFEWVVRLRHMANAGPAAALRVLEQRPGRCARRACRAGRPALRASSPGRHGCSACCGCSRWCRAFPACGNCAACWCMESGPLLSVLVIFLMVLFLGSVAVYFLERDVQPADLRQRAGGAVVGDGDADHRRDMATWCRSRRSAAWSRPS